MDARDWVSPWTLSSSQVGSGLSQQRSVYSAALLVTFQLDVHGAGTPSRRCVRSLEHRWPGRVREQRLCGPVSSPDGSQIVFRSERNGGGLFVVPALGGGERKIASFGYRPRWSRNGSQILFASSALQYIGDAPRLYVVGLDGSPPFEVQPEFLAGMKYGEMGGYAWHLPTECAFRSGESTKSAAEGSGPCRWSAAQ
jgi:hypothetical protein